MSITKSAYAEKFSFETRLTQDDALGWSLRSDPDKMREVQEIIARNPGRRVFLPDNPCHYGFHFVAIEKGGEEVFNLVSDYNLTTGELVYKTPQGGTDSMLATATWCGVFTYYYLAGAQFQIWSSGFASLKDGVAVLVCCAVEGFHPLVKYEWKKDGLVMGGETYPLVFVEVPGKVVCTVTGRDTHAECSFEVVGKYNITEQLLLIHTVYLFVVCNRRRGACECLSCCEVQTRPCSFS